MIIPFQVPLFCKYASPSRSSFMPFIQNMHVCNSDADFWMHSQNPFNLEYLTKQIFYPLIKKRRHRIIIAWRWNDNMTIYNGIVFEEHNAQDWRHTNYTLFLPFFYIFWRLFLEVLTRLKHAQKQYSLLGKKQ